MSKVLTMMGAAIDDINKGVEDATGSSPGDGALANALQPIILAVIFLVGIVAVVMIVLGGIQYSTSQGDPGKTKKAKDTIMYGIIGLVVAILAFAIVNFVLGAVFRI